MEKTIKELTMLLLYLNSWEEKLIDGEKVNRSWKNFRYEDMDQLEEEGLIYGGKKSKSVTISEKGMKTAVKLVEKYIKMGKKTE